MMRTHFSKYTRITAEQEREKYVKEAAEQIYWNN